MSRKMHLVAYLKTGPTANHVGGWRHPEATLDDILEPSRYERIAGVLEDACYDACFFADLMGLYDIHGGNYDVYVRHGGQISFIDPLMVLPIMARATRHIGLGATLSTTFYHPYHLARQLLSLDLISKGRVAWNVVTSATALEAQNFGMENLPPKDMRYDMADEVVEACMKLWHSWEPDAFVLDKESGVLADPSKVHYANYKGKYVSSRGPLSIPCSPQGHPVIMQAGASPRGREFAARWAEVVFAAPGERKAMGAFYEDVKARTVAAGRRPEDCKILVNATCIIGETESIARERADFVNALAEEELAVAWQSNSIGVDLTRHVEGASIAEAQGTQGMQGSVDSLMHQSQARGLSLSEIVRQPVPDQIVGTPMQVADILSDMFESNLCDGFVLAPVTHPISHETFARSVVPILQRRGLFRTRYEGNTLRENLRTP